MKFAPVALVLLTLPTIAVAQAPQIAPRASVVFAQAAPAPEATFSSGILGDGSKDYRYAGFWIGTGTGIVLLSAAYGSCGGMEGGCYDNAGQVLLGTLMVLGTLSLFGALVGAQFDR